MKFINLLPNYEIYKEMSSEVMLLFKKPLGKIKLDKTGVIFDAESMVTKLNVEVKNY